MNFSEQTGIGLNEISRETRIGSNPSIFNIDLNQTTGKSLSTNQSLKEILEAGSRCLQRIQARMDAVENSLSEFELRRRNRYQWHMLALILDRLLMFFFITAAVITLLVFLVFKRWKNQIKYKFIWAIQSSRWTKFLFMQEIVPKSLQKFLRLSICFNHWIKFLIDMAHFCLHKSNVENMS